MTPQEYLTHTAALAADAQAKHAAKEAAKAAKAPLQFTDAEIANRVQVVQSWENWSKSKPGYAGLKQTEHNFNVLGEALSSIRDLSIASIDQAVHRLTQEGRLEYIQATEKIVYREPAPLTDAQRKKAHERELMKFGPQNVRTEFDLEQDKQDAIKAVPMTQDEMDIRAIQHYAKEAAQIASIIDHYTYPRSKVVQEFRKAKLRQIVARDPDGYRNLIVELALVNEMLQSFSTEPGPAHDRALKEAQAGLRTNRPGIVNGW